MLRTEKSVTVRRPIEPVYAFLAKDYAETHPRWSPAVLEMHQIGDDPVALGSTFRHVRRDAGRTTESDLTVVDMEPNRAFSIRSPRGNGECRAHYRFAAVPDGTRVTFVRELDGAVPTLLEPLIGLFFSRELSSDFARFVALAEAEL